MWLSTGYLVPKSDNVREMWTTAETEAVPISLLVQTSVIRLLTDGKVISHGKGYKSSIGEVIFYVLSPISSIMVTA